jgi:hypothetical protein
MSKSTHSAAIDLKEIRDLLETAGGMFSWAAETLEQLGALYDAIKKQAGESSLCHLADLGSGVCDDRQELFFDLRDKFNCASSDLYELLRTQRSNA